MVCTRNLRMHYFILAMNVSGLYFCRALDQNRRRNCIPCRKSFDSVLCSNSKTMKFLVTTKGKDSSNKYSQRSSTPCAVVYLT